MAKDLIQLAARQEQLVAIADDIRASGSTEPVLMLTLASTLARLARLEEEMTGKAETHCCSDQVDDDLPF